MKRSRLALLVVSLFSLFILTYIGCSNERDAIDPNNDLVSPALKSPTPAPLSTPVPIALRLDIKPGSCPNALNPWTGNRHAAKKKVAKKKKKHTYRAVIPMAILGTADFDVTDIDIASITLDGIAPLKTALEDVATPFMGNECNCTMDGPDGMDDLTLKFSKYAMVRAYDLHLYMPGEEVPLTITGNLLDGTPFEATDCVLIVGNPPGSITEPLPISE